MVRAIAIGGDAGKLLSHYEARLTVGLQRHLATSLDYYRSGDGGSWWDQELEYLHRGVEWCTGKMDGYGQFRYRLSGFELTAIAG